jgi:hypothetical protein
VDGAIGAHRERGAQLLLRRRRADCARDDLGGDLLLLEPDRLLDGCAARGPVGSAGAVARTGERTPISSKGFMDILTFAISTADLSGLTRILTA